MEPQGISLEAAQSRAKEPLVEAERRLIELTKADRTTAAAGDLEERALAAVTFGLDRLGPSGR